MGPSTVTLRRPTTVATAAEFDSALSRGEWDLVIVGAADAQAVSSRLQNNSQVVLPVTVNLTDSQIKQARTKYNVVLKGPVKSASFLSAVDEAFAQRSRKRAGKSA